MKVWVFRVSGTHLQYFFKVRTRVSIDALKINTAFLSLLVFFLLLFKH